MIKFIVECSNFAKAAEVEAALKKAGIRYEVSTHNPPGRGRKVQRGHVTAEQVKDVLGYCSTHSNDTNASIGRHFDLGAEVIRRIRMGTHPMCKKVK